MHPRNFLLSLSKSHRRKSLTIGDKGIVDFGATIPFRGGGRVILQGQKEGIRSAGATLTVGTWMGTTYGV